MRTLRRLLLLLVVAWSPTLSAQQPDPRPLTLDDYADWNRIAQVAFSPDGRWLAYAHQPNEGDATLFVREVDGSRFYSGMNGSGARFSNDGRWSAFLTTPAEEDAKKLRDAKEPVRRTLVLLDLASGERIEEPAVRAFAFSDDGRWLAIHREMSDPDAEHHGSDLLLRDLAAATVLSFGNVSEWAFNEEGTRFAYLVDSDMKSGNGLYLVGPNDGRIRALDAGSGRYTGLAWNETGDALAALRGETPEGMVHRDNTLLVTTNALTSPATETYAPASDPDFPTGFVLSESGGVRWIGDAGRVALGIKAQEAERDEEDDERADVDVWHWADERLQSVQMVQAAADRRYTYTSVYNTNTGIFVRLATDAMRRVDITDDGRWGIGRRDDRYRAEMDRVGGRADYVRIDLQDGSPVDLAVGVRRTMGTSPDGAWMLHVSDESVIATHIATRETTDLTAETGIDFINRDFDLVDEAPALGVAGWTEDGAVLLNTKWDVWSVPLAGGEATAVSGGMGERESIRFRVQTLDRDADFLDTDDVVLSAYGEWTKKSGFFQARPGWDPQPLLFEDEMLGGVRKAADADRVVFTRQTFEEFPDYWVADTRFGDVHRVTDANPQMADFAWGSRVLVDYVDDRGNQLQATLALPAGYTEGERYPMVVYFYEKMSQRHHQFSMPVYDDRPHMSTYASNGYLVLMPDIVYDDGYPGSSALDDVTSAAQKVVELGYADPGRIGLQGHSWGGYETSFILTQTDMFQAIVTGAPLTNLMSMNNILYKRTGSPNGPILQWSQGRMGDQPWDDMDRWISQSPVHHAPDISTPFLILHGTEDGAVDWNQGLELYTAARRLGKEVILLSYPDEPHHLTREPNQKDFQLRMKQYFDHYLMGAPAPEWMTTGVPFLLKGRERPGAAKVIS